MLCVFPMAVWLPGCPSGWQEQECVVERAPALRDSLEDWDQRLLGYYTAPRMLP